jgi:tRNA 2-thiouridine synthesizing protein A
MTNDYDVFLDATGHDAPVPVIQTKEALDKMKAGEVLKVVASKEATALNIRMLVKDDSYELMRDARDGINYVFHIKKLNG